MRLVRCSFNFGALQTSAPHKILAVLPCERITISALDHPDGVAEDLLRDFDPKRPGHRGLDDQLELVRLPNRQLSRLLAFEDAADVIAGVMIGFRLAWSVTHQAAGLHEPGPLVDRRNC